MSNDWDGQQGQPGWGQQGNPGQPGQGPQGQPGWGQQGPGQQGPPQGNQGPGQQGPPPGHQPGWGQQGPPPGNQGQQGWGPQAQPTQYGGFQGQGGGYGPPPENKSKKKVGLITMVLVLVAGLATAGALVFVNRSDDGNDTADEASYVIMDQPTISTQPVFEPRDARGDDPFFPLETQLVSFQEERMATSQADDGGDGTGDGGGDGDGSGGGDSSSPATGDRDFDVAALEADVKTGLYGGTAENTCDPERLISFLIANPNLGEAWAQVQGITFAEIPDYIRSLRVEVLAEPVAVLNHGYNSTTKTAYEIDTILDAGTAVLVDENGDIRTRCYCGNPITPKPPTGHKPPACLIFPTSVWVEPGSPDRRLGVPKNVRLTNRTATSETGVYVEIMWGPSPLQMGWTPKVNASVNQYCRPVREVPKCPTGVDAPVYRTPSAESPFGFIGSGVGGAYADLGVYPAQVRPVGGSGQRVTTNGRVLVYFGHPSQPQNSGWVNLSDINESSTPADCQPIRVCAELPSATVPGTGVSVPDVVTPGFHRVEITGNYVAFGLAETGIAEDFSLEVRLIDHGNRTAWVRLDGNLTIAPDSQCDPGPIYLCIGSGTSPLDNVLLANPTTNPFAGIADFDFAAATPAEAMAFQDTLNATEVTNIVGLAINVDVTLVGSPIPTNGMVQVQVGGTGPIGWISASVLDGDACVPIEVCAQFNQPIYTNYKDTGSIVPGTPMAAPRFIQVWTAVAIDWPAGIMTVGDISGAVGSLIENIHFMVAVDGVRGWAPASAVELTQIVDPETCEPPRVECPSDHVVAEVPTAPGKNCCVDGANGWELVSFTGRTRPGTSGTEFEVSPVNGANFWWSDGETGFGTDNPCLVEPIDMPCPTTPNGTSQVSAQNENICCVAMEGEGGIEFVEMTVTGERAELGGQTLIAVDENNNPIPMDQFVASDLCDLTPDDECPEGQALISGTCCQSGQEVVNGQCVDPCPTGETRQADGTCTEPPTTAPPAPPTCRANQERLADGTCRDRPPTSCPSGQELVNGTCRDEAPVCPPGTSLVSDGTCLEDGPTCPTNFTYQGDDICCPNGTERLGTTSNCATPCNAGETRGDDGTCRTPAQECPEGQLTLLLECCPTNQEPNGLGQCVVPCPAGSFRNTGDGACVSNCVSGIFDNQGVCCQAGQAIDTNTGLCATPPGCPSGVRAPINNECCPIGQGIDLGGYCDEGCPTSQQTTSGCCFSGEVPNSNQSDCVPATQACQSDSDWAAASQECCPVRNSNTPAIIINGVCEYSA